MYTLRLRDRGRIWRQSIHTYATKEAAEQRIKELAEVGIKAKLVKAEAAR